MTIRKDNVSKKNPGIQPVCSGIGDCKRARSCQLNSQSNNLITERGSLPLPDKALCEVEFHTSQCFVWQSQRSK